MCNLTKSKKYTPLPKRKQILDSAVEACNLDRQVTIKVLAEYMGVSITTVRNRINKWSDEYWLQKSLVGRRMIE